MVARAIFCVAAQTLRRCVGLPKVTKTFLTYFLFHTMTAQRGGGLLASFTRLEGARECERSSSMSGYSACWLEGSTPDAMTSMPAKRAIRADRSSYSE